jgi:N-acetyl-gamma-glutamyl-phosphate reductase
MSRGLQVIVTACASARAGAAIVKQAFRGAYDGEPFVIVRDTAPETKHVRGAHRAEIFAQFDDRTGLITVITVIDNLVKGAAGSAIQNANLMLGLDERLGLPTVAIYP